jgi:hypothetical protein
MIPGRDNQSIRSTKREPANQKQPCPCIKSTLNPVEYYVPLPRCLPFSFLLNSILINLLSSKGREGRKGRKGKRKEEKEKEKRKEGGREEKREREREREREQTYKSSFN